ncbi:MAG: zinc ribbon domain-containing protein [Phycisphaerae bacterium]|nr:zinc ribbon domain-containing protein [Phycisphaerae bacterium]MCZ2399729.1 zinc ribbon domain-containing protein [Phycisphaerae bacterium]NUQ49784.1 zinc ribbon domain-containing protein [Phycisphaerae bacterium]
MPIYEYACTRCQAQFEELVRTAADERELACPKCGSRQVNRRPSVFSPRAQAPVSLPRGGGGCGRCGDPAGPCGLQG